MKENKKFTVISSKDNEKYKFLKGLSQGKNRNKSRKYLAEGLRTIELCIEYEKDMDMIAVSESFLISNLKFVESINTRVFCFSDRLFSDISNTENSQGIISVLDMDDLDISKLDMEKHKKIVILDRVQDPGNVGTIIRTADAAGFDLVVFTKGSVDMYNPKVVRSAMGSMFYIDRIKTEQESIYSWLLENGYQIVSTYLDTENYFDEVDYSDRCALVLGNEANGINDFWISGSTELVKIPMYGKAESLNVSVSSALMLYKIIGK